MTLSFNNFSGGYTRENAQMSRSLCNFVQGSQNIDIVSQQDAGFGFEVMKGNTQFASIAGKSIFNIWEHLGSDDKYCIAHTGDTVQIFNERTGIFTPIKEGLTVAATKASFDTIDLTTALTDKTRHLGFFCNGIDSSFIYEKGAKPETQNVTTVGVDGKTIKATICVAWDGRIWLVDGCNLYRSVQLDPFNFSTAESAGVTKYGSRIKGVERAFGGLLVSTNNGFSYIGSNGDGTYHLKELSTNYALNKDCMCIFDKKALFFSESGVYPVDTTIAGEAQAGNSVSYRINKELLEYGTSIREEAQLLKVAANGRDETWLHIPIDDTTSIVYILRIQDGDTKKVYWLPPRFQQRVNKFCIFKNKILSCTNDGKVLQEMHGELYDGTFRQSIALTPKVNFGNYAYEIECKPVLYLNNDIDNCFTVETISSGNVSIEQNIDPTSSLSGIWSEDEDDIDGSIFAENDSDETGGMWAVVNLNKIQMGRQKSSDQQYECSLQFGFKTKAYGDNFSIHCMDLTEIEKETE